MRKARSLVMAETSQFIENLTKLRKISGEHYYHSDMILNLRPFSG